MTVDPVADTCDGDLTLDSAGRPHMSYSLLERNMFDHFASLRYGYFDGTSWVTETVDRSEYSGLGSSLALDAEGNPRIAYSYFPGSANRLNSDNNSLVAYAHLESISISPTLPLTYTWSFGDGSPPLVTSSPAVSHTYTLPGLYTVTLTATNCLTAKASVSHTLEVAFSCEPVEGVDFAWQPPTPTAGLVVTLTAWASGTQPITYSWDLGDGTVGQGEVVTHTYAAAGRYTVTLTATNCLTATASVSHPREVARPAEWRIYLPLVMRG